MPKWLDDLFPEDSANQDQDQKKEHSKENGQSARPFVSANGQEGRCNFCTAALNNELENVRNALEGTRNPTLNIAAFNLGQLIHHGHLPGVPQQLVDVGLAVGLTKREVGDGETKGTVDSGLQSGMKVPREHPVAVTENGHADLNFNETEILSTDFWLRRPTIAHLQTYARARRASPWGVLGCALARIIVATPKFYVLPPFIGTDASLNLFVGLVGRPGAGKDAAEAVAAEAINVGSVVASGIGSGEGIAHLFMKRDHGQILQHTESVLLKIAEIDTLAALTERRGATLLPELRKAWMGQELGFAYADKDKRLPVPQHEYRLCLIAGIQPNRAMTLLNDTDGGTPQRFLWLPATDPDAPDVAPETPAPLHWDMPKPENIWANPNGHIEFLVCEQAQKLIDDARVARLRGDGEALDGHALLARLKVAAALGLMENRISVEDEDWELAGIVMQVSDRTRQRVQEEIKKTAVDKNRRQAEAEKHRAVVVAEGMEDAAVKRVGKAIFRKISSEWIQHADLRRKIAQRDRQYFDAAMEKLLDSGLIEVSEILRGR